MHEVTSRQKQWSSAHKQREGCFPKPWILHLLRSRAFRKQFGSYVCMCVHVVHVWEWATTLQPPPPTAGGLTVMSRLTLLPHSFGCGTRPTATSGHKQDVRGSWRILSRQLPGWSLAAAAQGLAARSLAGLSYGTLPASKELSAAA